MINNRINALVSKFNKNKIFEIGTGKGTSIIEAAKVIVNATGNKSKIIFNAPLPFPVIP